MISAIGLKLNDLDQLQHPAVTAENLIPLPMPFFFTLANKRISLL